MNKVLSNFIIIYLIFSLRYLTSLIILPILILLYYNYNIKYTCIIIICYIYFQNVKDTDLDHQLIFENIKAKI